MTFNEKTKAFIGLLSEDKFYRDIWIRHIGREKLPPKERVDVALSILKESYPEVFSIFNYQDLKEAKVFIHHTLYSIYDKEPRSLDAERTVIDSCIKNDLLTFNQLLFLVKNTHHVGWVGQYIGPRVKEMSYCKEPTLGEQL